MKKILVYRRPEGFVTRSGLAPLAEVVGAAWLNYPPWKWWVVYDRWWPAGIALRRFGQWFYRSEWSDRIPLAGDWTLARQLPSDEPSLVHFIFAEFAAPRWRWPYTSKGSVLLGTFHASEGRQEKVHGRMKLGVFDWISVVSTTQRQFFLERGFPEERLRVTYHGVDTDYFHPGANRSTHDEDKPLRGLIVGATERDHTFSAALMKALPAGIMELSVAAPQTLHACYRDIPNVILLPYLSDTGLLQAYQESDILIMPLNGATANNALLESMACGTPVMVNRIGGVPEYVSPEAGILVDEKKIDDWVAILTSLADDRGKLESMRTGARRCAESKSWSAVSPQYLKLYEDAKKGCR